MSNQRNGYPVMIVGGIPATIYHGQATVTTAGTAVALGASEAVSAVTVKALHDNAGIVYVGGAGVDDANGYPLAAGEAALLIVDDVASVYVDADSNGDGVGWYAS